MKNLIYIDEEPRARNLLSRRLQTCVGQEITVVPLEPAKNLDAMIEHLEKIDNIVSVVIDQRLNVAGTADYLGTDVVSKFRMIDTVVPMYILTNHVDDIDKDLGSIEYVLNKDDLVAEAKLLSIGERIRRHINISQNILNEKESRFEELLRKRFDNELSDNEKDEFSNLKFQREKKMLASTFLKDDELNLKLQEAESKLEEIERMMRGS